MAYTAEQLAQVRQAIIDLGTGARVVSVTHNGRTVQYAASRIEDLRSLERSIVEGLASASRRRRSRTRYTTTSKGL
ncbi:gpW family head-tail joining protein [Cobetia marina]|uniref:gpW family head-tail joining protein n=1 Tax=Cobetia marina TaxID=28258 RepID=UPI00384DB764